MPPPSVSPPSTRSQTFKQGAFSELFLQMEWLRIELASKSFDLVGVDKVRSADKALADMQIVEIEALVHPRRIRFGLSSPQNGYNRTAVIGRKLTTAMSPIRIKITNTTACVIANGGSDCVGANALRAETFMKLCVTRTKV
jgi:hypothetical protein